jgi:hypothetical protein
MERDDQLIRVLLWLAIEDYAGLWEAVWELNTRRPETPESENRRAAEQVLRELLGAGHVRLFRSREPYEDVTPISTAQADTVLGQDESWAEPVRDGTSIRFGATPAGEAAYNELMRGESS